MGKLQIIKGFLTSPSLRFYYLRKLGFYDRMSDETYLKKLFASRLDRELDLDNPKSFNEKLQWLKLNDRKSIYTSMVDKYEAKKFVAAVIGEEFVIPTLGVWENFDDIDFDNLPNEFVLKCTHDSGGLIICRDKNQLDINQTKKLFDSCIKNNYYLRGGREWPYKNVHRRIIAEQLMKDSSQNIEKGLTDYKFYCFNGKPKYLYVSTGMTNHKIARIGFLNIDWTKANFGRSDYLPLLEIPKKPQNYEKMIELSKKLSRDIPFLRVDLYEINGRVYFGELTFTPCGGLMPFDPPSADYKLGELLVLPQRN